MAKMQNIKLCVCEYFKFPNFIKTLIDSLKKIQSDKWILAEREIDSNSNTFQK